MTELITVSSPISGVQVLQLNSPATKNALTINTRAAIADYFRMVENDDSVRCVVITGGEQVFSAGADVKAMMEYGSADVMREAVEQYWLPLKLFSKPLIAAVNGYALGGGCELALHADIIVAGTHAQFGQPEVCLGIMPGSGGTQRLPRAVGKFRAMKLLLTGARISAQEAFAMGLVSDVVADENVMTHALALAKIIASQPQIAVRRIKQVVLAGLDVPLDTGLLLETQALQLLFDTADQKEGMRAFVEKRKPKFQGL